MTDAVTRHGLSMAAEVATFVEDELLPGLPVEPEAFWRGFAAIVADLTPENAAHLERRGELQAAIDEWHRERAGRPHDAKAYRAFLEEIGYIEPVPDDFSAQTEGTDPEIASVAGPQLVCPVTNRRFALNAANARWGSLYDALYGTDALGDAPPPGNYDPERGRRVVDWAKGFLDEVAPLLSGSHRGLVGYRVGARGLEGLLLNESDWRAADASDRRPNAEPTGHAPVVHHAMPLGDPDAFVGFEGPPEAPRILTLRHHGLHVEIVIDRESPIGASDAAGVADVRIEAALTTIMDLEDSIAAVDAEDKVDAWRAWLGLMKGDLTARVDKGEGAFVRALAPDRTIAAPDGGQVTLKGRALMLVRNVGHLMRTPAIRDENGAEVFEGLADAMMTVAAAMHDRLRADGPRNSATGAIYVVKPKMHGSAEVAFADKLFGRVEEALGLPRDTVKIGVMDEERRTSVNLEACLAAVRRRVFFINTGFLDRTGDEIRTSTEAGPMVRKAEMKTRTWIAAYEDRNVDVGLAAGLPGRGQIGKGMWAAPDLMADLLEQKIGHPQAGASCAWVPSPTAATLHAVHYHRVDVARRQAEIAAGGPRARREDLLDIPLGDPSALSADEVRAEVENNAQSILGYVSRWVDQGVGASKVPDIHDIALMEDRATCRISSQHIANWLRHGVIDREQVEAAFRRMAEKVDAQNAGDAGYRPMAPDFDGPAFRASLALALEGLDQPSGYTEPLLHRFRLERKALDAG